MKRDFPIKDSMREVPILRRIGADGNISPDRIITYGCFNDMIKSLGQRAGYKDKLTPYCFRRGFGSKVNGTSQLLIWWSISTNLDL